MARGDMTLFEEFAAQLGGENHIFGTDIIKVFIIDNSTPPTAADTTPTYADYSANEVSGTGYTAGGEEIAGDSYAEVSGVGTMDGTDVVWSYNAAGFTGAYWAPFYNDTNGTDMAIGFVDLGGPVSQQDGNVTVSWNASGIFTITVS